MKKLKMKNGKSIPISISYDVQQSIKEYKRRLEEMSANDEIDEQEKKVVNIVIHKLDPYEMNLLCAYYSVADESSSVLGKLLGISPGVAASRIKGINNKIKQQLKNERS